MEIEEMTTEVVQFEYKSKGEPRDHGYRVVRL